MKLYRVKLNGMTSKSSGTAYGDSYVVTDSPDKAYATVREFLDKEDLGFRHHRGLDVIELLADTYQYNESRTMLFIQS